MTVAFIGMLLAGPLLMALVAGVCHSAATGRLGRNGTIGLRTAATLESSTSWQAGHRGALAPAIWSAGILAAADLVALLLTRASFSDAALTAGLSILFLGAIAWILIASTGAARAAATQSRPTP